MAFDFGAGLMAAGELAPAAKEAQRQNLLQRQQTAQTLSAERAAKMWIPMRSYTTADGAKHTVYFTPQGLKDEQDTPSPFEERQQVFDKLKAMGVNPTPEDAAQFLLAGKLPTRVVTFKPLTGDAGKPFKGKDDQWYVYGTDESGKVTTRPLPNYQPPPMTPYQEALSKYRASMLALNQAKLDALTNPKNPAFQLKVRQLQDQADRDRAYLMNALGRTLGVDIEGRPLPGAPLTATGAPVGASFAADVRPTGTEIGRADLAQSTLEQIDDVKQIISSRPDLFGPTAGRETDFKQWLGSQDPDAQRFRAATDTIASHLSGVYGARGAYAQGAIAKTIGENRTNPAALRAALDQYAKAARTIRQRGTRMVVGGVAQYGEPSGAEAPKPSKALPGSGKIISLKRAKTLPQFQGKSDAVITAAAEKLGYKVVP